MTEIEQRRQAYQRMTKAELLETLLALEDSVAPGTKLAAGNAEVQMTDAVECISQGFCIYDKNDRLVHCNQNFKEMFGYSDSDIDGFPTFSDLLALDADRGTIVRDADGMDIPRLRLAQFGDGGDYLDLPLTDGRWLRIRDRQTTDGGTVSIHTDVTAQKKTERDLAEKEAQLRVALEHMPGGMRLIDKDRNYVFFNSQYAKLYDFPDDLLTVGDTTRVENLFQAQRGDFGPGDPAALTDEWLSALPVQTEPTSWERKTVHLPASGRAHGWRN